MNQDWRDQANCRGTDTDAFFPEIHVGIHPIVRRICGNCDVRSECLEWALRNEANGFWGGTTMKEREVIRRNRGIRLQAPEVAVLGHIIAKAS